jgi:hypothetical protein
MLLTLPDKGLRGLSGDNARDVRVGNMQRRLDRVQDALQPLIEDPERALPRWPHEAELNRLDTEHRQLTAQIQAEERGGPAGVENLNFKSGHWDEPNVLGHVRFNDRTRPNGEKLLHLEELQSDWHQKGRSVGYNDSTDQTRAKMHEAGHRAEQAYDGMMDAIKRNGALGFDQPWQAKNAIMQHPDWADRWDIRDQADRAAIQTWLDARNEAQALSKTGHEVPDAPFKKTWPELLLKRMVRYAAENGYDGISWTPGVEQVKRYPEEMRKQVDRITWTPAHGETGEKFVRAFKDGQVAFQGTMDADGTFRDYKAAGKHVDDVLGKSMGGRIRAENGGEIEGKDFTVGGEGMKGFYDKIVPDLANRIGKPFGAKVGETRINTGKQALDDWKGDDARIRHIGQEYQVWAPNRGGTNQLRGHFSSELEANRFINKHVEPGLGDITVPYLPIPDAMRQSVLHEGQPLFKKQTTATTGDHDTGKSLEDAIEDLAKLPKRKMSMAEHAEAGADMAIHAIADKGDALKRTWAGVKGAAAGAWQSWNAAQPMTDYHASLGDLREAEFKAAMHVDAYQKELKRVAPSEKEREAMTVYGEAKDDAELKRWNALAKNDDRFKRYRPAFEQALNLTPEQRAVTDAHRRYYDQQLKILTDAGLLPAGASHYAMHMFASDPETLAKLQAATDFAELAPNPAFLKRRVYKSYFDAIAGGEKPKTLDAGKILSAYHDAFTKTFNTRAFVRSLLYGKADESRVYSELPHGFSVLERPNSNGKIEYFVQTPDGHVFDNKGQPKDEAIKQVIDRLNQESGSRPIAIMESRGGTAYVENSAAGKARIVKQPKRPLNVDDYVRIPASQLRNFTWELTDADREMLAPGYGKLSAEQQGKLFSPDDPKFPVPEGKILAMQGDILIHPDYAGRVSDLVMRSWFDTESDHLPVRVLKTGIRAVKTVGGAVKSGILYGSGFHQVQLGVHALDHWINPFKLEELKTIAKDAQVLEGVRHGLKLTDIDPEGVLSGLPGMGTYHRYLFRDWIPRLKAKSYKIIDDRNMHKYGGTKPGKEAQLTRDEIHLTSAAQTNAAFSGQDPAFFRHLSFMNNRTFKAAEHLVMFSPDFTKARGQFVAQGFSKFGHEQRLALIRGALVMYATARVINAALNHDKGFKGAHWEPESAFTVVTPQSWGSVWGNKAISMRTVYGDIARLIQDPVGWGYNRLNPVTLRPTIEFMTGRDNFGRQETKEHFFKNYAKQSTPIPIQKLFTTSDEGFVESFFTALGANMATYRTPLETEAYKLRIQGIPDKPQSEDKEDENRRNVQMVQKVRDGRMTATDVWNQVNGGTLSAREAAAIVKRAGMTELQYNVNHLEFDDALTIWNKADAGEKLELKDVMEEKAGRKLEDVEKAQGEQPAQQMEAKLIGLGILER